MIKILTWSYNLTLVLIVSITALICVSTEVKIKLLLEIHKRIEENLVCFYSLGTATRRILQLCFSPPTIANHLLLTTFKALFSPTFLQEPTSDTLQFEFLSFFFWCSQTILSFICNFTVYGLLCFKLVCVWFLWKMRSSQRETTMPFHLCPHNSCHNEWCTWWALNTLVMVDLRKLDSKVRFPLYPYHVTAIC